MYARVPYISASFTQYGSMHRGGMAGFVEPPPFLALQRNIVELCLQILTLSVMTSFMSDIRILFYIAMLYIKINILMIREKFWFVLSYFLQNDNIPVSVLGV